MPKPFVYFFFRTPYGDLLSRRLIKLEVNTILEWFQLGWDQATQSDYNMFDWVSEQCGGRVYGLWSIFEAAREKNLDRPQTWQELHELLLKHLSVQGRAADCIHMDAKSLRVKTDDDESDLAYYFIETFSLGYSEPAPLEVVGYYKTADLGYIDTTPVVVEYHFTDFEALQEQAGETHDGGFEPAINLKTVLPEGDKP